MDFSVAVTAAKAPLEGIERGLKSSVMGFKTVYTFDHFFFQHPSPTANQLECWMVLATLAAKTERLRVGSLVTSVGYRHPSVLAKMAATLDVISNGRLTFGVGAGWYKPEYQAYGIPFPPYQDRMDQLEEALQIFQAMWTQETPSFKGKHFTIEDAYCNPKPIQSPLPILIGGNNEDRLIPLAAKYADNYNAFWISFDDCKRKFQILEEQEKRAGRSKGAITRSYFSNAFIVDSSSKVDELVNTRWSPQSKQTKAEWKNMRFIGTIDQIARQIEEYEKIGAGELIFTFGDNAPAFPEMTQLAREIIPSFTK